MGAEHPHPLYHHGHSRIHRLAPEAKIAGVLGFVLAVALTPPRAPWAFAIDAVVVLALVRMARLPARFVLARLVVIVPFLAFAFLIPFVAGGERTAVLGLSVSREGSWAAFGILAKATLGVTASILLAGTTEEPKILEGLRRLRVPEVLTMIASFMLRYLTLLATELGRMRTAMAARGYDPRWVWQARPIATAAGALFVRSYERGERIHAAMLSRGFTGSMPTTAAPPATAREWGQAALVAVTAGAAATLAVVLGR